MERELTVTELKAELAEKDRRIEELETLVDIMKAEQEEMIGNFQASTQILIDRLKNETEEKTGIRPQTAQLLSQSRLQGRDSVFTNLSLDESIASSQRLLLKNEKQVKCHSCGKSFSESLLKKHTVLCYR